MLGSCAGLIMLDRDHLGLMDMRAQRNAFGRQIRSFEADLELRGLPGGPLRAIFIRAPWIAEARRAGGGARELEGHPVAARQGALLAVAFHAELGADERLHALFLRTSVRRREAQRPAPAPPTPASSLFDRQRRRAAAGPCARAPRRA